MRKDRNLAELPGGEGPQPRRSSRRKPVPNKFYSDEYDERFALDDGDSQGSMMDCDESDDNDDATEAGDKVWYDNMDEDSLARLLATSMEKLESFRKSDTSKLTTHERKKQGNRYASRVTRLRKKIKEVQLTSQILELTERLSSCEVTFSALRAQVENLNGGQDFLTQILSKYPVIKQDDGTEAIKNDKNRLTKLSTEHLDNVANLSRRLSVLERKKIWNRSASKVSRAKKKLMLDQKESEKGILDRKIQRLDNLIIRLEEFIKGSKNELASSPSIEFPGAPLVDGDASSDLGASNTNASPEGQYVHVPPPTIEELSGILAEFSGIPPGVEINHDLHFDVDNFSGQLPGLFEGADLDPALQDPFAVANLGLLPSGRPPEFAAVANALEQQHPPGMTARTWSPFLWAPGSVNDVDADAVSAELPELGFFGSWDNS